jgi:hypothetical protein
MKVFGARRQREAKMALWFGIPSLAGFALGKNLTAERQTKAVSRWRLPPHSTKSAALIHNYLLESTLVIESRRCRII